MATLDDTAVTARLAEALHAGIPELSLADCELIAGAALPVVREIADQRAAEELAESAVKLDVPEWAKHWLRARAAALRGEA